MKRILTGAALLTTLCMPWHSTFAAEGKPEEAKPAATPAQDPEEAIRLIEKEFFKQRDPQEQTKVFQAAKQDFLAKFPKDPNRWKLKIMEAVLMLRTQAQDGEKGALPLLNEVKQAADAPDQIRGQASGFILSIAYNKLQEKKGDLAAFKAQAAEHFKAFPKFADNAYFARWVIEATIDGDDAHAVQKLEELTKSDVAVIAETAKERLESAKAMAELKSKPLDLKFTSVDGKEIDVSKMRGKVILIDFWATWCGPCMREVPNVVATYNKLHDKGFEIIGISFDEDKDKLVQTTKAKNMTWQQYFDGKGWQNKFGQRFGIESIPTMWLIDKKGMVATTEGREDLEGQVEKLLKQ